MKFVCTGAVASVLRVDNPSAAQERYVHGKRRDRSLVGDAAYVQPRFSKGQDGTGSIANAAAVASLTASF